MVVRFGSSVTMRKTKSRRPTESLGNAECREPLVASEGQEPDQKPTRPPSGVGVNVGQIGVEGGEDSGFQDSRVRYRRGESRSIALIGTRHRVMGSTRRLSAGPARAVLSPPKFKFKLPDNLKLIEADSASDSDSDCRRDMILTRTATVTCPDKQLEQWRRGRPSTRSLRSLNQTLRPYR